MKRRFILLLCLLLISSILSGAAASANDAETIRVGMYENRPKIFTGGEGNASGFWPEILEYIASEEGWEIEYVHGTWDQCLTRLEKNEIDMMPDVAYTEDRSILYDFSNETVYVSWSRVYTREGIDIESIVDLGGKNIAVLEGSVNVEGPEGIKTLVDAFDIDCTFTEADSYLEVFELVESGEADAGVASKDFASQHQTDFNLVGTAIIFQPSSLYFAFPKGSSTAPGLIERIDYHMEELKGDTGSVYYQSLEEWFGIKPVVDKSEFPMWLLWMLIGVVGVALLLVVVSLIIRSQVRARTKALANEITERKQVENKLSESEEKYRNLVELANDGICIVQDAVMVYCNPRLAEMWGGSVEEFINTPFANYVRPDDFTKVVNQYNRRVTGEQVPSICEAVFRRKDGSDIYVELNIGIIDYLGNPAGLVITRDITERREMAEKYRRLLEDMSDGYVVIQDGVYVFANRRFGEIFGYDPERLIGEPVGELAAPDRRQWVMETYEKLMRGEEIPAERIETTGKKQDGTEVVTEVSIKVIQYEGSPAVYLIVRDITERNKMEQSVRKVNRALNIISQCNQTLIRSTEESQLLNEVCRIIVEDGGYRMAWVGFTGQDEGKTVRPVAQRGDEEGFLSTVHITWADTEHGHGPTGTAIRTGKPCVVRDILSDPSYVPWRSEADKRGYASSLALPLIAGGQTFGSITIYAIEPDAFNQEETTLFLEMANDLAYGIMSLRNRLERDRAQDALQKSEQKYRTLLENIPQKVFHKDRNSVYVSCNASYAQDLKINPDEITGKTDFDFFPGELAEKYRRDDARVISSGGIENVEEEYILDGEERVIQAVRAPIRDEGGDVIGVLGVFQDITKRKKMQEQLIVTDRLASVGELAAGIAHELNNPLTGVIGFSDLLMGRKDVPEDIREDLATINKEAVRASQVARHLLTFARKHPDDKRPTDINEVIQLVLRLRAYEQRVHNIKVVTHFAEDLPAVMANDFQLQQVFINIIINAEHFMIEEHDRGVLTITTEQQGDIVRASFADDGPGIAPGRLPYIFDPFFTTKEVGKGTGLGLSICYGIITEHGGNIWAESEEGKGVVFAIELPVYITEERVDNK